jgi:hypothetical protein
MPSLGTATTGNTPFSPQWLQAIGTLLVDLILAQVALALGNISILGVAPFAFLTQWGHDLQQSASDAYIAATNAQTSADTAQDTADTATGIGTNAQYSADVANAGVALLNAQLAGAGTVFTDTFNRGAASNLGSDYDRTMGSGSGAWGPDGTGDVVWTIGGSTNQVCLDRISAAPATTKTQAISTVLTSPPGAGQFGDNARTKLGLRMDAAKTTYVVGIVDAGLVEIGYVNSGTYTRIGATQSVTQANGDLWEFRAGAKDPTTGVYDDYRFELLQNNLTVCARVDGGHSSQAGSASSGWVGTYDYGAIIANAGTVQFGFFTFQLAAPTIQVLTFVDRTP